MRVLLAFDGSVGATEAVALVGAIAWPSDSLLRVVSVIEPMAMPIPGPWGRGVAPAPELGAAVAASVDDAIREVVQRLAAPGRSVEGAVLRGRAATRNVLSGSAASVLVVRAVAEK